jgi:hypothetical protein
MPPPKPLRRFLTGLAAALALGLFALPGVSRADTVPTWTVTSDTTPDVSDGTTISCTLPAGQGKILARLVVTQK